MDDQAEIEADVGTFALAQYGGPRRAEVTEAALGEYLLVDQRYA
jgi:hypothetical protein